MHRVLNIEKMTAAPAAEEGKLHRVSYLPAAVKGGSDRSTTAAPAAERHCVEAKRRRESADVDKFQARVTVKGPLFSMETSMSTVTFLPRQRPRPNLVPVMARVEPEVRAKVEQLVRQQPGISMSEVIRVAIERLLAEISQQEHEVTKQQAAA
jgi:hypothetical protein